MNFDFGIAGKKYLVTGASSGIGQAAAILISKFGGTVILNGRNEERLNQTLSQMEGEGHHIMPFDLTSLDGIKQYVKECIDVDGQRFDGLVFSTGISTNKPIRAETIENLHKVMTVNFYSYFALIKEFNSRRVLNDGGSIVAVSSAAATNSAEKSQLSYAGSKAALDIACLVASKELVQRKVRVNTVQPHITRTPMVADFLDIASQQELEALYPLGALEAMDVAGTILFLLSALSSKITGQSICLSAGNDGMQVNYYHL